MYINTHCNYSQPTLIKLDNDNIGGHLTPLQPLALRSPDLSENAFKQTLKTHLFSTARRHWDVFMILAPDINIQTYLLTLLVIHCKPIRHYLVSLITYSASNITMSLKSVRCRSRSFKMIGYHSKVSYGFLVVFHTNYGRTFSRFDTIHERDRQTPIHHTTAGRTYA